MLTAQCELFQEYVAFILAVLHDNLVAFEECALLHLVFLGERQTFGGKDDFVEVLDCDLIVGVEDEAVLRTEVLREAELGFHVVLHLVVIAVKVVRSDVRDDRDVRTEIVAVVELETADLQHVVVKVLGGHLESVALADVAAEAHVESCVLKQIVDQGRRGGLSVASCDADLFRGVVAAGELDLGDDVRALRLKFPHDRH